MRGQGYGKLIIEGDSGNAIKQARGSKRPPWKLIILARKISTLCTMREVSFSLIRRSANRVADFLAKWGVDKSESKTPPKILGIKGPSGFPLCII